MKTATSLLMALTFAAPLFAQEGDGADEKIDSRLIGILPRVKEGQKVPVVILGCTQFLETPGGFAQFCEKNKGRRRSELRREVVAKLKEIAKSEQRAIVEALGFPEGARSLWIVNAIAANLTVEELKKAAALDKVKFVYPGQVAPRKAGAEERKIGVILEPGKREPFDPEGKKIPWNLVDIGAEKVWKELKVTGESALVAMLDIGVKVDHEDLKGNIWINEKEVPNNGEDDDGNGYVDDYYGYNFALETPDIEPDPKARIQHGSLTSGIVAGDGTGGTVTGVAPRSKIMPLMGSGIFAAFAFQYALEMGADVVNMSFSHPNLGDTRGLWRMMSDNAVCAGLVLVSGAGNFQQQVPIPVQIRIPEGIPSVICAGGVNRELEVPGFCSLGPVEWESVRFYGDYPYKDGKGGLIKPDVCGFPGPNYPVIWPRKGKGYIDPNKNIQGNSFSSPHISGTVALMLSANPELTAWRVKEILEETAKDIAPPGKDPRTGAGLADAYAAVKKAIAEKEG